MRTERKGRAHLRTGWQWIGLAAACLTYGVLMSLRTEVPSATGRIAVAALAGVVLSFVMRHDNRG
jgi:hypothetical protein